MTERSRNLAAARQRAVYSVMVESSRRFSSNRFFRENIHVRRFPSFARSSRAAPCVLLDSLLNPVRKARTRHGCFIRASGPQQRPHHREIGCEDARIGFGFSTAASSSSVTNMRRRYSFSASNTSGLRTRDANLHRISKRSRKRLEKRRDLAHKSWASTPRAKFENQTWRSAIDKAPAALRTCPKRIRIQIRLIRSPRLAPYLGCLGKTSAVTSSGTLSANFSASGAQEKAFSKPGVEIDKRKIPQTMGNVSANSFKHSASNCFCENLPRDRYRSRV